MFTFRPLVPADLDQLMVLARFAFSLRQPEQEGIDRLLRERFDEETSHPFGVFDGGSLIAACTVFDYRMHLRGGVVPMGGVGSVCSRSDRRGEGGVRFLLSHAVAAMHDAGHAISLLGPFNEGFYRKYGWELFDAIRRVKIAPSILSVDVRRGDLEIADRPYPDEAAQVFYNTYAATHYSFVQRGSTEWKRRTRLSTSYPDVAARGVVQFSRGERVVGLIGYDLCRRPDSDDSNLRANLFIYDSPPVKREMLAYLKRLSHQVRRIELLLPTDELLWPYLDDSPEQETVEHQFMARLVGIQALDGLALEAEDLSLCVEVTDPQAPWNAGPFTLTVADGRLSVARGGSPTLRSPIGPLSSVIAGRTRFKEMIAAGRIEALAGYSGEDLPKAVTLLVDYF
jgi:predicted acetyltransferase